MGFEKEKFIKKKLNQNNFLIYFIIFFNLENLLLWRYNIYYYFLFIQCLCNPMKQTKKNFTPIFLKIKKPNPGKIS